MPVERPVVAPAQLGGGRQALALAPLLPALRSGTLGVLRLSVDASSGCSGWPPSPACGSAAMVFDPPLTASRRAWLLVALGAVEIWYLRRNYWP